ncbi:MAG TPA: flagellar basal body-associated FliL family protein [Nocardioides sp.]|nr:flagellar basal body-associated FliL family protein [Nocardioides sp.]
MITVTELKGAEGTEAEAEGAAPRKSRKKLLVLVVAVLVVAAACWWFLLRPSAPEEPKPGAMLPLESTQINLAGGHYLKIGIALQLVEGAAEVDGSKALDATIELFSGRDVADISKAQTRKTLKRKLGSELEERYDGDVMGVYFTEFVTQ